MSKKDEFKNFVRNKPELESYVRNGKMTWQKFYEIYDIYGENDSIWTNYMGDRSDPSTIKSSLDTISNIVKNIDIDSIQKHINNAQKALGIVGEITNKTATNVGGIAKTPKAPRPLNKFFED